MYTYIHICMSEGRVLDEANCEPLLLLFESHLKLLPVASPRNICRGYAEDLRRTSADAGGQ